MSLLTLTHFLPSFRTFLTVLITSTLSAAASFALFMCLLPPGSSPTPSPLHDPRFVTLGHLYLAQLGNAYAGAWDDGATLLESGQGVSTALQTVTKSWESNRIKLFENVATPEFVKLIPDSTKDADVAAPARAALAAAWRGFAIGLRR